MTLPKSAAELAEEFASSYGPPGKRQHVNQAFMAGHAAGIAQSRQMLLDAAAAIEFYNTMRGPLGVKHVADIHKALAGEGK